MNGYPHRQHAYQKTSTKYQHGPEPFTAAKDLYAYENDRPHDNDANDISAEHIMTLCCFIKVWSLLLKAV